MASDTPQPKPDPAAAAAALPKPLQYPASTPPQLITQGAEGRLYKTTYLLPDLPCALKYRLPKPYRHPVLDQRLTKQRIVAEARILAKCRREGIAVPAVYAVDESAGCLYIEWIEGEPVRAALNTWLHDHLDADAALSEEVKGVMRRVGRAVGRLHQIGIVHGDLTTSNMMLRPAPGAVDGDGSLLLAGEIVVIDFGLSTQSIHEEDRAVDLYVLERAFGSSHPRAEVLFDELLEGYKETFKQASVSLRKLEDVRMRGRKRSMLG
ncbi:related to MNORI-2 protein [Cephalotrichum gorgonifer]|uniref:EKC/KEOPS complex subunit BUD32 n=1 Tax=Cephalotrichum gorgonifer TaxID=2041049 RepID=A0AAE8MRP5_9PEZI|nr:related to MNORI-2 protein [Cephalotrichum gorgonifer]